MIHRRKIQEIDAALPEPEPGPQAEEERMQGLGDLVHRVARPIAGFLDRRLGTSLQGCGGCARRRAALNERFPFSDL